MSFEATKNPFRIAAQQSCPNVHLPLDLEAFEVALIEETAQVAYVLVVLR